MKTLQAKIAEISDEQKEIIYSNMFGNYISSWWSQYKGQSLGHVLHWAYVFIGFDCAESCTVGQDAITWHGEVIPFKFEKNVCYFEFPKEERYEWREVQQGLFKMNYPEVPERFKNHEYIIQKHEERLNPSEVEH